MALNYKAGRDTGSVVNWMMGTSRPKTPVVGMGATKLCWTDRHACTITYVSKNAKRINVREDKAIRTDNNGMSENQQYRYEPDPQATEIEYSLRRDGTFVRVGQPMRGGERLLVGVRDTYHDFSF